MQLVSRAGRASAAEEQAALRREASLRRIATLVAGGATADELFSAVACEVSVVLDVPIVTVDRYELDGGLPVSVVIASHQDEAFPIGGRWPLDGPGARAWIYETGRPARIEDFSRLESTPAAAARRQGMSWVVGAPIIVDGEVWGNICAGTTGSEPIPEDAELQLADFTDLVSIAIANAAVRDDLRRLAEEQAALRRVATLVAEEADPAQVFAAVAAEVARLIPADGAALIRYEPDGTVTGLGGWNDDVGSTYVVSRYPPEGTVSALVFETGRPVRLDSYDGPGVAAEAAREQGWKSGVGAPISVEGRLWGVLSVVSKREVPLPPDTEQRLVAFSELVGTAVANTQGRQEVATLAEEQAALRRVATLVASDPASEQFFSIVAREVASVLKVPGVIVQRYEADGTILTFGEAFDSELAGAERFFSVGSRMPRDPGSLAAQVFDTHRPARLDDFSKLAGTIGELARAARLGSGCAGPIVVNGELWGKMCVFSEAGTVLPVGTENRLRDFIELVATAIANYEARADLAASEARARELGNEQAALRRVATLVAQGASPDELFSAVAEEVAAVVDIPIVGIRRYEADGTFTVLGNAGATSPELTVGSRWPVVDDGTTGMLLATGRPARKGHTVAVPIVVEGRIWGLMAAADKSGKPLPADLEERLARFTELVATAVSNATTRAELLTSRARVVSAADETRRRLERNLHDGIQQWLVALALRARKAAGLAAEGESAVRELSGLADDLVAVTDELREISRGIHPAILSDAGIDDALGALARRSTIPVDLDVNFPDRYDSTLEATVYYVAAESITNAVKHAQASTVTVRGGRRNGTIELEITDDGIGGADPRRGTGLIGLKDRVDTLGGAISFASPAGAGTTVRVTLPFDRRVSQRTSG